MDLFKLLKLSFLILIFTLLSSCNFSIENEKNIKNKVNVFTHLKQQLIIETLGTKFITDISTASGSCIDLNEKKSIILTVAHFCEEKEVPESDIKEMLEDLPIDESKTSISTKFQVVLFDGSTHDVKVIKFDNNEDLCLVEIINGKCKNKIEIANNYPKKYSKVSTLSAPLSIFSPTNVLVFDGRYIGIENNNFIFTLPSTYGSSGSPVINDNLELVSIIKMSTKGFQQISIGTNLNSIKEFINNK